MSKVKTSLGVEVPEGSAAELDVDKLAQAALGALPDSMKEEGTRQTVEVGFEVQADATLSGLNPNDHQGAINGALAQSLGVPVEDIKDVSATPAGAARRRLTQGSAGNTWVVTYTVTGLKDGKTADEMSDRMWQMTSDATLASVVAETTKLPNISVAPRSKPSTTAKITIIIEVAESDALDSTRGVETADAMSNAVTGESFQNALIESAPGLDLAINEVEQPEVEQVVAPSPPPPSPPNPWRPPYAPGVLAPPLPGFPAITIDASTSSAGTSEAPAALRSSAKKNAESNDVNMVTIITISICLSSAAVAVASAYAARQFMLRRVSSSGDVGARRAWADTPAGAHAADAVHASASSDSPTAQRRQSLSGLHPILAAEDASSGGCANSV